MHIGKNLFFVLFLFPLFGFSQTTDSLFVYETITSALEKNKEGKEKKLEVND